MYLTVSVLGPTSTAEHSVTHYEARRHQATAQAADRQPAQPTKTSSTVRGWVGNLIPALQR